MRRRAVDAALARLAPHIPPFERGTVLDHAIASAGLRSAAPEEAAWLSLVAVVRHRLTDYDQLLAEGYDAESARHFVADAMRAVLLEWGAKRRL